MEESKDPSIQQQIATNDDPMRLDEKSDAQPQQDVEDLIGPALYRLTEGLPNHELAMMISEAAACEAELLEEIRLLEEALLASTVDEQADETAAAAATPSSNVEAAPKEMNSATIATASAAIPMSDTTGASAAVAATKTPTAGSSNTSTVAPVTKSSPVDIMLASEITPPDRYPTASALMGRLRDPLAMPLPPNSSLIAIRQQQQQLASAANRKKLLGTATPTPEQTMELDRNERNVMLEKQRKLLQLASHPEYRKEHVDSATLLALWKKISTHRSAAVFRKPVNPKEAPGYTDRILFPIDLTLVRKMITSRLIKSYADLQQRIGLICHNCVKFNGRESDYGVVTREFEAYADDCFTNAVLATNPTDATTNSSQPMNIDPPVAEAPATES